MGQAIKLIRKLCDRVSCGRMPLRVLWKQRIFTKILCDRVQDVKRFATHPVTSLVKFPPGSRANITIFKVPSEIQLPQVSCPLLQVLQQDLNVVTVSLATLSRAIYRNDGCVKLKLGCKTEETAEHFHVWSTCGKMRHAYRRTRKSTVTMERGT